MTLFDVPPRVLRAYRENLADWLRGGPAEGGWTRTGPAETRRESRLTGYRFAAVAVEDVLAKNPAETSRWHVAFLRSSGAAEDSAYYREYLLPRYGVAASARACSFRELYADMRRRGVVRPVWVADVATLSLGFRYFRFDGCHRACAAACLGFASVPACVFTAEAL